MNQFNALAYVILALLAVFVVTAAAALQVSVLTEDGRTLAVDSVTFQETVGTAQMPTTPHTLLYIRMQDGYQCGPWRVEMEWVPVSEVPEGRQGYFIARNTKRNVRACPAVVKGVTQTEPVEPRICFQNFEGMCK